MKYQGGILDLDGVITQTAKVHAKAWKKMFDQYNQQRKEQGKSTFNAFSLEEDYPNHLDGVPRYDGVQAFLASRDIELPYGDPSDPPDQETICGLGNRKNEFFRQALDEDGVEIYQDTVDKVKQWKADGLKIGVISSSKNCKPVLEKANLIQLFDVIIDGVVSNEMNIKGKPAPDIFLEAAKSLDISPQSSFMVEDAIAGVKAGKDGKFACVVGIASNTEGSKLKEQGADLVVKSLKELDF
ncbi:MAG: HAD family hydrolase [Candidatus Cyclobacteriaceae bacterium M3_2C_046]